MITYDGKMPIKQLTWMTSCSLASIKVVKRPVERQLPRDEKL